MEKYTKLVIDNKVGTGVTQTPLTDSTHYLPEHKDFLFQILKDIKTSSTRYLTNGDSLVGNDSRNSSINGIIKLDSKIVSPVHSVKSNGIFQFPILEKTTCLKVIQEVLNIHRFYPTAPLNAGLLGPLICKLYNLPSETIINTTQAIVVFYKAGQYHKIHRDDSDYTLNICLGLGFIGGKLEFAGSSGSPQHNGSIEVEHRIGHAILHEGHLLHSAQKLINEVIFIWRLLYQYRFPRNFPSLPFPTYSAVNPNSRESKVPKNLQETTDVDYINEKLDKKDWFQRYIDATFIMRKNLKCIVQPRPGRSDPIHEEKPGLPNSVLELNYYAHPKSRPRRSCQGDKTVYNFLMTMKNKEKNNENNSNNSSSLLEISTTNPSSTTQELNQLPETNDQQEKFELFVPIFLSHLVTQKTNDDVEVRRKNILKGFQKNSVIPQYPYPANPRLPEVRKCAVPKRPVYDKEKILISEIGDFFEVEGVDEDIDFSDSKNVIHYET